MEQEVLNRFEEKGLSCAFIVSSSGDVRTSRSGESLKRDIHHVGTLLFETMSALGDVMVDSIELFGEVRGITMALHGNHLVGCLYTLGQGLEIDALFQELIVASTVVEKQEEYIEAIRVPLEATFITEMKKILNYYLGDFAERIYRNQIASQRINVDEVYVEDARRLIVTCSKAAAMIIGPSKSREMKTKLLELLK